MSSDDALIAVRLAAPATDLVLPAARTLVLVTQGSAETGDGTTWQTGHTGDALVVGAARRLRLITPDAELVAFAQPECRTGGSSRVPAALLEGSPRAASLAQLLRENPAGCDVTRHLVEALHLCLQELAGARRPLLRLPTDSAVQRAVELVEADLSRRWSVSELARKVGLSRAAFARRFRAALNSSPERYFTSLRLERAAYRLLVSDDTLPRIATDVGYASPFAFHRAFKRRFGLPPGTYRRQSGARHGLSPVRMVA